VIEIHWDLFKVLKTSSIALLVWRLAAWSEPLGGRVQK